MCTDSVSVQELKCLYRIAKRALRQGDVQAIEKVNERLGSAGLELIVRDKHLYVRSCGEIGHDHYYA